MWPSLSSLLCLVMALPYFPCFSAGFPLTDAHPPSDPWGSAGSMIQPGYSAVLGNSPHLGQHSPFTAINPQDRMVCSVPPRPPLIFVKINSFFSPKASASLTLYVMFSFKKRHPLPLSPQNYPLHGSEVNGAHPTSFHAGSSSFGVPSHTPPIAGTETIMGKSFVCRFSFKCQSNFVFKIFI